MNGGNLDAKPYEVPYLCISFPYLAFHQAPSLLSEHRGVGGGGRGEHALLHTQATALRSFPFQTESGRRRLPAQHRPLPACNQWLLLAGPGWPALPSLSSQPTYHTM